MRPAHSRWHRGRGAFARPGDVHPQAPGRKNPHLQGRLEGDRKQVTVLFADLKGSMELMADRDPEEGRKLLDPVLDRMIEAVHRYEGTVNQVMGDGIMALFGALVAHCHFHLGKLFRKADQQEQAREHLTSATTMYREMDMRLWLDQAEAEMHRILRM